MEICHISGIRHSKKMIDHSKDAIFNDKHMSNTGVGGLGRHRHLSIGRIRYKCPCSITPFAHLVITPHLNFPIFQKYAWASPLREARALASVCLLALRFANATCAIHVKTRVPSLIPEASYRISLSNQGRFGSD